LIGLFRWDGAQRAQIPEKESPTRKPACRCVFLIFMADGIQIGAARHDGGHQARRVALGPFGKNERRMRNKEKKMKR
jgi:hypothetical protein